MPIKDKEKKNKWMREWRKRNPDKMASYIEKRKEWLENNRESQNKKRRDRRALKKGCKKRAIRKLNGLSVLDKKLYIKLYRKNRPDIDKIAYQKIKSDPLKHLKSILRIQICKFVKSKGIKRNSRTEEFIGCSFQEVKKHLEKQFIEGMSWENHGKWHIDHIKPLSLAKNEEDMKKLCHYKNLQPLWAIDNIRKSNKY